MTIIAFYRKRPMIGKTVPASLKSCPQRAMIAPHTLAIVKISRV